MKLEEISYGMFAEGMARQKRVIELAKTAPHKWWFARQGKDPLLLVCDGVTAGFLSPTFGGAFAYVLPGDWQGRIAAGPISRDRALEMILGTRLERIKMMETEMLRLLEEINLLKEVV